MWGHEVGVPPSGMLKSGTPPWGDFTVGHFLRLNKMIMHLLQDGASIIHLSWLNYLDSVLLSPLDHQGTSTRKNPTKISKSHEIAFPWICKKKMSWRENWVGGKYFDQNLKFSTCTPLQLILRFFSFPPTHPSNVFEHSLQLIPPMFLSTPSNSSLQSPE